MQLEDYCDRQFSIKISSIQFSYMVPMSSQDTLRKEKKVNCLSWRKHFLIKTPSSSASILLGLPLQLCRVDVKYEIIWLWNNTENWRTVLVLYMRILVFSTGLCTS